MYSFKKKKLNLREIHRLYLLLKPCLPEKEESYLIYEMIEIMNRIGVDEFRNSMKILHKNNFDFQKNPGQLALLFTDGLKRVNFFSYAHFIKSIKNGE